MWCSLILASEGQELRKGLRSLGPFQIVFLMLELRLEHSSVHHQQKIKDKCGIKTDWDS